ncbi:LysM domain containing protein [Trema orientale]|uniref:LysM domain containing protein n=1 Tax=Trema orientale TaxID=63057 RepID=A0A2P5DYY1_TREOI|nr:LysM domain containing protein [Trema orientale]
MGSTSPAILLGLFLISVHLLAHLAAQPAPGAFKCSNTKATCQGLVDYKVPNATALSVIKTRFGVENLNALLGANNYPTSTPPSRVVAANQTIKIPFPCACVNGSGVSDGVPVYAVKDGDGLDHIARDVFAALVTFQQIAAASGVPDPNLITVGQKLKIPLPCSCEPVNGTQVVHYGHVVQSGSTVEEIAQRFGTTNVTLLELNGMTNASDLLAGQVLDVPLRGS